MFYRTIKIKLAVSLLGVLSFAFQAMAQDETLTSGLNVYIPSYVERFDWSLNYGGNDGGSGLEDYPQ